MTKTTRILTKIGDKWTNGKDIYICDYEYKQKRRGRPPYRIFIKQENERGNKKMTSKEALSDLSFLAIGDENHTIKCKETIEKDLNQLEEYRNIEEEIGIDLIKAVEICKQVNSKKLVYIKDDYGIYPIKIFDDLDVELCNHRLYSNSRGISVSLDLKDYGKTWALTREELEDETIL